MPELIDPNYVANMGAFVAADDARMCSSGTYTGDVADGSWRDAKFIIDIGFPVFARFYAPRDVVCAWSPDAVQQPLDFRVDRIVQAGDLLSQPGNRLGTIVNGNIPANCTVAAHPLRSLTNINIRRERLVAYAARGHLFDRHQY